MTTAIPHARTHTLVVVLRDRPGALHRLLGAIRRHGCNVDRLVVEQGEPSGTGRAIIAISAEETDRLRRQITRLIDVLSVSTPTT